MNTDADLERPNADQLSRYVATADQDAWRAIVQRYQLLVFQTCLPVLQNRSDAEDAAQECCIAFASKAVNVRSSLVVGWLHLTATYSAIEQRHSRAGHHWREHAYATAQPAAQSNHDLLPHLDDALAQLPDGDRLLLVGCFLRQRDQAEIASALAMWRSMASRRIEQPRAGARKRHGTAAGLPTTWPWPAGRPALLDVDRPPTCTTTCTTTFAAFALRTPVRHALSRLRGHRHHPRSPLPLQPTSCRWPMLRWGPCSWSVSRAMSWWQQRWSPSHITP